MLGRPNTLSRETCPVIRTVFIAAHNGTKSRRVGVGASIVALKPSNVGGAKGRRKVDVR